MSYHILHISEYGCKLSKERGLLVCKKDGAVLGKIAIEDLRAVVIVAGGVSISGEVFSSILANDAIILHCKNYKPVGISVPNCRTYDARVVLNQSAGNKNLNAAIWRRLLCAKIENCAACLGGMDVKDSRLHILKKNGAGLPPRFKRVPLRKGILEKLFSPPGGGRGK